MNRADIQAEYQLAALVDMREIDNDFLKEKLGGLPLPRRKTIKHFILQLLYGRRWERMRATAAPYSPAPGGTWDYQPRERRAK